MAASLLKLHQYKTRKLQDRNRTLIEAMNGWGVRTASVVAAPRRRTLFGVGGLITKESVTPKINLIEGLIEKEGARGSERGRELR